MAFRPGSSRHRAHPVEARPEAVIRRLGPGDEDALAQLATRGGRYADGDGSGLRPLLPDDAARFLADDRTICLVAEMKGLEHAIGFLYANVLYRRHTALEHLCLYEIGVDRDHRGRGVAQALVAALGDVARKRGIDRGFVITQQSNREAMSLYQEVGGMRGSDDDVVFVLRF